MPELIRDIHSTVAPDSVNDDIGPIHVTQTVVDILLQRKIVEKGQRIIMTRGDLIGEKGAGTNSMKIVDIH